jgi:hypothetical protein
MLRRNPINKQYLFTFTGHQMTKVSFKKFSDFVDLSEDLSDDQICEIFGLFKNNAKVDQIKAARASLTADQVAKKKAADAAAAEKIAKMRRVATGQETEDEPLSPAEKIKAAAKAKLNATPGTQMRGAQSRAAERNWALGESVGKLASFEDIIKDVLTDDKYYYQIFNNPKNKKERAASKYLRDLYDEVADDKNLHKDDDFEKIESIMFRKLEKQFKD